MQEIQKVEGVREKAFDFSLESPAHIWFGRQKETNLTL